MNTVILSQDDTIAIPSNIIKLYNQGIINILAIVAIDHSGSISNKKNMFLKGFGFIQFFKMAKVVLGNKIINILDNITRASLFSKPRSLKLASKRCKADYLVIKNPNDQKFLKYLDNLNLDLIISFSAPCVFKKELLGIPKIGCLNLHCSLLPNYAGLLPSFWTIFFSEKEIGATVHFMDDKIDNGDILGQISIPMPKDNSMYSVIMETKLAGGRLFCKVIENISNGNLETKLNSIQSKNYYSWPTLEQIREFRSRGGKLI